MEKQGVVRDENEAPVEKQAESCDKPKCCQKAATCGTDVLSKAAEAAATTQEKDSK